MKYKVESASVFRFYALAAAAALLKFIEFMKSIIFTSKSLKIEYQSPENVMAIGKGFHLSRVLILQLYFMTCIYVM